MNQIDLKNQRFGLLFVLEVDTGRTVNGGLRWLCRCDCGVVKTIASSSLRTYGVRSCGCLSRIALAKANRARRKPSTSVRTIWRHMISRCTNSMSKDFKWYGARGIKVCDRWLNSQDAFFEDMGERPVGKQIDRTDNDGNYEPGNCRWVTPKENSNNRRARSLIRS